MNADMLVWLRAHADDDVSWVRSEDSDVLYCTDHDDYYQMDVSEQAITQAREDAETLAALRRLPDDATIVIARQPGSATTVTAEFREGDESSWYIRTVTGTGPTIAAAVDEALS